MRSAAARRALRSLRGDDAVSDVVGSIMLVSITVALMGGLSLAVLSIQGPPDTIHADIQIEALPGDVDWGTGDEQVVVRHLGGEPLPNTVQIHITVDGTTVVYVPNDQGFADGQLRLGEDWAVTQTINEDDDVSVTIVDPIANALVTANGEVGVIPVAVPGGGANTYVDSFVATEGSVTDFAKIQSGTDGGETGVLAESTSLGVPTTQSFSGLGYGNSVGLADPSNVLVSDDQDAVFGQLGDSIDVQGFSIPSGSSVSKVYLWFEAQRGGGGGPANPPDMELSYKVNGVPGATTGTFAVDATGDALYGPVDVSSDRAWTKADIDVLTVSLERMTADNAARDADVDHVYIVVTYTPVGDTNMDVELHFAGVPSFPTHEVQIRYKTATDTFDLQVWDAQNSVWNTRDQLASITTDQLKYTLQVDPGVVDEYNGGAPLLRILDRDTDVGQGTITMDYARVVSS